MRSEILMELEPESGAVSHDSAKEPSRKHKLSQFDSQGVHVTWGENEEKDAEETLKKLEDAFSMDHI